MPIGSANRYPNASGEPKPLSKQIMLSFRIFRVQFVIIRVQLLEKKLLGGYSDFCIKLLRIFQLKTYLREKLKIIEHLAISPF
jgi:hypothetical protein